MGSPDDIPRSQANAPPPPRPAPAASCGVRGVRASGDARGAASGVARFGASGVGRVGASGSAPAGSPGSDRSAIVAAVLTGLGPGAGHSYVGRPLRGAVLVVLMILASLGWIAAIPVSYAAARGFAFPPLLLLAACIVDSVRLARRAPRPYVLPGWQRWWVHAAVVAGTGFLLPTLLGALLGMRAGIVQASDDAMSPVVRQGDWVVIARDRGISERDRGRVLAVDRPGRAPDLRRLVALPGETVSVRRGVATVEGLHLPQSLARPMRAADLTMPVATLRNDEILVLGDGRHPRELAGTLTTTRSVIGKAGWILLPSDLDPLRLGTSP